MQRHCYVSGRFEIAGVENEERSHGTLGVRSDFSQPTWNPEHPRVL